MSSRIVLQIFAFLVFALTCFAQDTRPQSQASGAKMQDMPGMSGMSEQSKSEQSAMQAQSFIEFLQMRATSGTDAEPASTPFDMLMMDKGQWTWMLHGVAFLNDIQQSGPRGGAKLFSTNWLMPMVQRKFGRSTLTLRTMLSLEPATISGRRYPELFQQGETAFGVPIVDGQHPHDLFMELAAIYDYRLKENTLLSIYLAPMGDPALGPSAYPHRASASEDPLAPLGHHLEDSTHVAADVITVGIAYRDFRVEASGFHGREPDENRWNVNSGKIDSWSTRATLNFHRDWSLQYSIGQLHSPEAVAPDEDVRRMTASLIYNRPISKGNWASLLVWGRNQSLVDGNVGNGFLLESTLKFQKRNAVWGRVENVDRTNELLNTNNVAPGFSERYFARIQAYTAGYDRELGRIPHLSTALGAQLEWYGVPEVLRPAYGAHPVGGVIFLRLRISPDR